jgi:hypothetical protein
MADTVVTTSQGTNISGRAAKISLKRPRRTVCKDWRNIIISRYKKL